jgi:hypothetical protein
MYDGAAKLKSLGWFISDDLLMDFIMVSLPARYKKCTHNAHILKVYNFRKLLITCKGNMISLMNGFKRKVIKLSHELFQRSFPLTHGGFKGRVIDYKLVSYLYDTLRAAPVCHRFCAAKLLVCQRVNAHNNGPVRQAVFWLISRLWLICCERKTWGRIQFVKMATGDAN